MNSFPGFKTYVVTFLVLIIYLCIDFYGRANTMFFQLNYNWDEATTIARINDVYVDSISMNYLIIKTESSIDSSFLEHKFTFNIGEKHFFRAKRIKQFDDSIVFSGGFWLNSMPSQSAFYTNLEVVNLSVVQKGEIRVCMIGDSQLTYRTGKFTRKSLFLELNNIRFVGETSDLYGFPYNATTLNNTQKIIDGGINIIPQAEIYILFLGAHEKDINKMEENLRIIVCELLNRQGEVVLVTPPRYTNSNKLGFSESIRRLYLEYTGNRKVKIIDLYNQIEDPSSYLISDGIHLNKMGHELLTDLISTRIKEYGD